MQLCKIFARTVQYQHQKQVGVTVLVEYRFYAM